LKNKAGERTPCGVPVTGVRFICLPLTTPNRVLGCELHLLRSVWAGLQNLGQFSGERAFRFLFALSATAALLHRPVAGGGVGSLCWWSTLFRSGGAHGSRAFYRDRNPFGGLRRVGSKNLIFQRGSVEPADDRLHFVRCWRLDKRESLRFLRLVVPDDLNRIRDKVFSGEPLFNVVRSDPYGQITQKDSKTHSVAVFAPWLEIFWRQYKRRESYLLACSIITDRFAWCNVTLL